MHKYQQLTFIAVLAAITYVLMYLSFPLIPIVPWLKIDFSSLIILLGMVLLGLKDGLIIALIAELLYLIMTGPTLPNMIGVSSNLLAVICLCVPLYLILKKHHFTLKNNDVMLAMIVSTLLLTTVMGVANYFVITPLYINLLGMKLSFSLAKLVIAWVIPFNLIKGIVINILFLIIFRLLKPYLTRFIKM